MSIHSLRAKVAIVTGATRGIGAEIARKLASRGCDVILNYSSPKSAIQCHSLATKLATEYRTRCIAVQADMSSLTGPSELIDSAKSLLASQTPFQVDIVINNAGIVQNATVDKVDASDFDWMFHTNVRGPLLLVKSLFPYLPKDRSGRIINISSISSTEGFSGQAIYGGTKAALEAMTRTWARELAERCTVNSINPGPVMTDMWTSMPLTHKAGIKPWLSHTPLAAVRPELDEPDLVRDSIATGGRPAYPSEIAGIVGMLCSEDSALCTGQVICANGGMRMAI